MLSAKTDTSKAPKTSTPQLTAITTIISRIDLYDSKQSPWLHALEEFYSESLEKESIEEKESEILSPLNRVEIGSIFTDGEFDVEFTPYGIRIWAVGSTKFYHLAIEEFFNFMERLEEELA